MIINSAIEHPETDTVGYTDLSEQRQQEVREAVETLEETREALDGEKGLEGLEQEFKELSSYEGRFEGDLGDHFDCIGELSGYVTKYLEEFDNGKKEEVRIGDFMQPLEGEGADIQYNGNEDGMVHGDPGLCLVTNTIAENGSKYGDKFEAYQMSADIEELDEGFEIEIWDNGPGIPEDYDGEDILKRGTGQGTGNGLYYASEIVKLFGGEMTHPEYLQEKENGYGLRIELQKPEA